MEQLSKRLMNWASILEDETRAQAEMAASMPFIHPHLALMPDAHLGLGASVGSVIPTLGAIIPACVGVDLGCGMCAVCTQWTTDDFDMTRLPFLREMIENAIPLSAGNYNTEITHTASILCDELAEEAQQANFDPSAYAANWPYQLGTLGSGNHFIEITVDEQKRVWAFLHSGSRGIGNRIAQRHIKIAKKLCEKWWISLPHPDLAYLVEGTPEFWTYIRELWWAQRFAFGNREEMMYRLTSCLSKYMGELVDEQERVQCHHNFTQREHHFGKDVWVSRKGAIEARDGQFGLIPGSMGTASYVVVGRGNKLALNSAPHGAGRHHSRSAARRLFTHEQLLAAMEGIEFRRDTAAFIDEIPSAYKPIDQVMVDAGDLVEIRHTLRQILNVKGE